MGTGGVSMLGAQTAQQGLPVADAYKVLPVVRSSWRKSLAIAAASDLVLTGFHEATTRRRRAGSRWRSGRPSQRISWSRRCIAACGCHCETWPHSLSGDCPGHPEIVVLRMHGLMLLEQLMQDVLHCCTADVCTRR
jgi:hypothetical protein